MLARGRARTRRQRAGTVGIWRQEWLVVEISIAERGVDCAYLARLAVPTWCEKRAGGGGRGGGAIVVVSFAGR